jgi:tetratricopeptide (TPR) repeat protein
MLDALRLMMFLSRPIVCMTITLAALAMSTVGCTRQNLWPSALTASLSGTSSAADRPTQATRLIEQALQKEKEGDDQAVMSLLDAAIKLDPNSDRAYYDRGTKFLNQDENERAIADFNQALQLNPQRSDAHINRGDAWSSLGEFAKAAVDYRAAIRLTPQDSIPYEDLGWVLHRLKDYPEALTAFQQALKLAPKKPEIYYNQAIVYAEMRRFPEALADYDEAIRLSPNYLAAYINRAIVKQRLKDLSGALTDLNRAIALNPTFPKPHFNRGDIHILLHDYKTAIIDFDTALKLGHPNQAGLYSARGLARSRLGDTAGAIADSRKAMELAQQQQDELNQNMYVLAQRQLEQLLSTGQIGADFDTGGVNTPDLYIKATQKIHKGDYQGAITDFTYLIALQPDYYGNYNNRGIAYSRFGQHQQAADDFAKVIELNSSNGEGYFNRAIEYRLLNARAKSIQDLQTAAALFKKQGNGAASQRAIAEINGLKQ